MSKKLSSLLQGLSPAEIPKKINEKFPDDYSWKAARAEEEFENPECVATLLLFGETAHLYTKVDIVRKFLRTADKEKKRRFLCSNSFKKISSLDGAVPLRYHEAAFIQREVIFSILFKQTGNEEEQKELIVNCFPLNSDADLTDIIHATLTSVARYNYPNSLVLLLQRVERDEKKGKKYRIAVPKDASRATTLQVLAEHGNVEIDLWNFFAKRAVEEVGENSKEIIWNQKRGKNNESLQTTIDRTKEYNKNFRRFMNNSEGNYFNTEDAYTDPSKLVKSAGGSTTGKRKNPESPREEDGQQKSMRQASLRRSSRTKQKNGFN